MHATISDVILDTVQNSIEANARRIELSIFEGDGYFRVEIKDDGKGMDEATLARAFNPFFSEEGKHDRRKVGLGLPILKQLCDATGGSVELSSEKGGGTHLKYSFKSDHIDLPPVGDLPGTILTLFNYPGDFDLVFAHNKGDGGYAVSRSELSEAVGGFEDPASLSLARDFLRSQEEG